MKERPILFSGPMVRAILEGSKTQTRRVVKPVGNDGGFVLLDHGAGFWPYRSDDGDSTSHTVKRDGKFYQDETPHACPYGQPGDRLWVREAFSGARAYETHGYPLKEWGNKVWYWANGNPARGDWTKPRPSIHMPRHLSRITLEIAGVRVERLQDISYEDAIAEGIEGHVGIAPFPHTDETVEAFMRRKKRPQRQYADLWESINGAGSWDANPWVWVVEFRRV